MKPLTDDWLDLIITWQSGISHDTVVRLVADLRAARADRDAADRALVIETGKRDETIARLHAELADIKRGVESVHRTSTASLLRAEKAESDLARVRELCAASLGRDDYGFCPQDVLAAIEEQT